MLENHDFVISQHTLCHRCAQPRSAHHLPPSLLVPPPKNPVVDEIKEKPGKSPFAYEDNRDKDIIADQTKIITAKQAEIDALKEERATLMNGRDARTVLIRHLESVRQGNEHAIKDFDARVRELDTENDKLVKQIGALKEENNGLTQLISIWQRGAQECWGQWEGNEHFPTPVTVSCKDRIKELIAEGQKICNDLQELQEQNKALNDYNNSLAERCLDYYAQERRITSLETDLELSKKAFESAAKERDFANDRIATLMTVQNRLAEDQIRVVAHHEKEIEGWKKGNADLMAKMQELLEWKHHAISQMRETMKVFGFNSFVQRPSTGCIDPLLAAAPIIPYPLASTNPDPTLPSCSSSDETFTIRAVCAGAGIDMSKSEPIITAAPATTAAPAPPAPSVHVPHKYERNPESHWGNCRCGMMEKRHQTSCPKKVDILARALKFNDDSISIQTSEAMALVQFKAHNNDLDAALKRIGFIPHTCYNCLHGPSGCSFKGKWYKAGSKKVFTF